MDDLFLPVGSKTCKGCGQTKPLIEFDSQRLNRDGKQTRCKACRSLYMADLYQRTADQVKAKVQARRIANLEQDAARHADYYKRNKRRIDAQNKAWRKANWHRLRPIFVLARYERDEHICRATPAWADLDQIREIYRRCDALTQSTGIKHNVDHELPLRGRNVCGLHVHTNLQILTEAANKAKSNHHS